MVLQYCMLLLRTRLLDKHLLHVQRLSLNQHKRAAQTCRKQAM
jgi:hypothetical protein